MGAIFDFLIYLFPQECQIQIGVEKLSNSTVKLEKRRGCNFEALFDFCHYFLFYGLLHLFMEVCIALLLGAIVLIGMKYEL